MTGLIFAPDVPLTPSIAGGVQTCDAVHLFFRPVLNTIIEHMLEMATLAIVYLLTPLKEKFLEEGYGSHHHLTGGDVSIPIILANISVYRTLL